MTKSTISPSILDAVEGVLSETYSQPLKQVHDRVGMWARVTIAAALRQLVEAQRASFIGDDRRRKYRKAGMP